MKRIAIYTTLALLLAGTGVVGAQTTTDCSDPQNEAEIVEGVTVPVSGGRYFYLPQTEVAGGAAEDAAAKLGFWEESNKRTGLQTEECWKLGQYRIFRADTYLGAVVP